MKNINITYLFIILIANLLISCNEKDALLDGKTEYIVFSNAYFWGKATNNAVLLTDKSDIKILEKLYNNNLADLYKSGYDYQVHFFDNDNKHLYTRTINSKTDIYTKHNKEIKTITNRLVNEIRNSPIHHIFNLRVNIQIPSDSIISLLKKDGLQTFLLSEQNEQYPKLKLVYCEPYDGNRNLNDAEKRFNEIIQDIKFYVLPIDSSYIHRSTTSETKYVNFKTNKISRLYYFPTKTNMDSVITNVNNKETEYLFAEQCPQFYYLQLLSNDSIQARVMDTLSRYSFISEITKANDGFIYEKCDITD